MLVWVESGMTKYDAKKKREYYLANRDVRLDYQNSYYKEAKSRFQRRNEIDELLEPEVVQARKKKLSDYNKAYYAKNREQILAKRRESKPTLKTFL